MYAPLRLLYHLIVSLRPTEGIGEKIPQWRFVLSDVLAEQPGLSAQFVQRAGMQAGMHAPAHDGELIREQRPHAQIVGALFQRRQTDGHIHAAIAQTGIIRFIHIVQAETDIQSHLCETA